MNPEKPSTFICCDKHVPLIMHLCGFVISEQITKEEFEIAIQMLYLSKTHGE